MIWPPRYLCLLHLSLLPVYRSTLSARLIDPGVCVRKFVRGLGCARERNTDQKECKDKKEEIAKERIENRVHVNSLKEKRKSIVLKTDEGSI